MKNDVMMFIVTVENKWDEYQNEEKYFVWADSIEDVIYHFKTLGKPVESVQKIIVNDVVDITKRALEGN
jgi:hypothetical protein